MGLMDKLKAKLAAMGPDYAAALTEALGPDDVLVACGNVTPAAYERGGGVGGDAGARLLRAAVDTATNAVSGARHVGGEAGSIAQSLPRDGNFTIGALSASGLSLWSFGQLGNDPEPSLIVKISGDHIRSAATTGQRAQGGQQVVRFTFSDDSFFDYRMLPQQADFFDGCLRRWPA